MGPRATAVKICTLLFLFVCLVSTPAHADDPLDLLLLDPNHWAPPDLLRQAVDFFNAHQNQFDNQKYMAVIDFRPRSDRFRFFVINLWDGTVERYHTAHGSGSIDHDRGLAVRFGNEPGSNKSSIGFARTDDVYYGSQNRSLRLDGLTSGTTNLRSRGIVIHGADQVHESNVIQGLGGGCPMLDFKVRDRVIDELRDGALVYFGYSRANY